MCVCATGVHSFSADDTLTISNDAPAGPNGGRFVYVIADAIKLALEEDIADIGDISSLST